MNKAKISYEDVINHVLETLTLTGSIYINEPPEINSLSKESIIGAFIVPAKCVCYCNGMWHINGKDQCTSWSYGLFSDSQNNELYGKAYKKVKRLFEDRVFYEGRTKYSLFEGNEKVSEFISNGELKAYCTFTVKAFFSSLLNPRG
ncbi:hypothetical protein M0R19_05675 [Candidatus Pacearchaeota archaeon]|nr:hypothetical protein [Candidatus Pacearchaeota archaeon]